MRTVLLNLEDQRINYSGRIDFTNPEAPEFIFPSSAVEFRFIAKELSFTIENRNDYYRNYIGVVLDGNMEKYEIAKEGWTTIEVLKGEDAKEHSIQICKIMDSCHVFSMQKIELDDEARLLEFENKKTRKIEFYGDSITAGEITEAEDYVGQEDPEHDGQYSNVWYAYSAMTARKLNAEIHNIAQGGIALLANTGWYQGPNYYCMEEMWDQVHYSRALGKDTKWDFSKYTPDVVVVAIGQNDSNPEDYMAERYDSEQSKNWRRHYKEFIQKIRKMYPQAAIVLQTTLMFHHENWDLSIEEVCRELNDDKIKYFKYRRNGKGTPGHLRICESEEMATELAEYIEKSFY